MASTDIATRPAAVGASAISTTIGAAIGVAVAVDGLGWTRRCLVFLALATTSPIATWAAASANLVDPHHALLLLGGLVSGFLAGLLGIGGALISLPVLYAALPGLGVPVEQVPTTAVATALVAMLPTTVIAAWRQHARGVLDIATLRRMAGPMALGAIGGAMLASQMRGPVLALMFAVQALFYGSSLVALRAGDIAPRAGWIVTAVGRAPCWIAAPALAGFCACVGMGGGSMVAPYVQQRFALPFRHAVATASALNLCIALGGTLAFVVSASSASTGTASAHWSAALLLAAGSIVAVSLGVAAAHRLPTCTFRRAVGAINLVAAATLVAQVVLAA